MLKGNFTKKTFGEMRKESDVSQTAGKSRYP